MVAKYKSNTNVDTVEVVCRTRFLRNGQEEKSEALKDKGVRRQRTRETSRLCDVDCKTLGRTQADKFDHVSCQTKRIKSQGHWDRQRTNVWRQQKSGSMSTLREASDTSTRKNLGTFRRHCTRGGRGNLPIPWD